MKSLPTKEERDAMALHERRVTRIAARARVFLKAYDEFFPEYPYALSEPLEHLCEATDALGSDDVGTIRLQMVGIPIGEADTWGVQIVDARGNHRYYLSTMLTYEGACTVLKGAESFFESIGMKVAIEEPA